MCFHCALDSLRHANAAHGCRPCLLAAELARSHRTGEMCIAVGQQIPTIHPMAVLTSAVSEAGGLANPPKPVQSQASRAAGQHAAGKAIVAACAIDSHSRLCQLLCPAGRPWEWEPAGAVCKAGGGA